MTAPSTSPNSRGEIIKLVILIIVALAISVYVLIFAYSGLYSVLNGNGISKWQLNCLILLIALLSTKDKLKEIIVVEEEDVPEDKI